MMGSMDPGFTAGNSRKRAFSCEIGHPFHVTRLARIRGFALPMFPGMAKTTMFPSPWLHLHPSMLRVSLTCWFVKLRVWPSP